MSLRSRVGWAVFGVGLSLAVPPAGGPEPTIRYVGVVEARLDGLPVEGGAPQLGKLSLGTAVEVHEERDGYARVTIHGWVPLDQLREDKPKEPPARKTVQGLAYAESVGLNIAYGSEGLRIRMELLRGGEPVVPAEGETPGPYFVSVFEEREIAGGTVRGKVLGRWEVPWEAATTEFELTRDQLESEAKLARVTVRFSRDGARDLFGSAREVPLTHDKHP